MTSNWGNLINKRVGVYLSKIADEHLERILNKGNDIAVGTNAHIKMSSHLFGCSFLPSLWFHVFIFVL